MSCIEKEERTCWQQLMKESIIDINRFSDYNKLINVTARVIKVIPERSLFKLGQEPEAEDFQQKCFG